MMTYIALLRGINVGGNRIVKMAELKNVLLALGLKDVKTYIQSGNVLFLMMRSSRLSVNRVRRVSMSRLWRVYLEMSGLIS